MGVYESTNGVTSKVSCREPCCPGYTATSYKKCERTAGYKEGGVIHAQSGILVPNAPGSERDRVPIMAEPGELVVPKSTTRALLDSLEMNANLSMGNYRGNVSNINQSKAGAESGKVIHEVVLSMNDNLAEFVTAKQREGKNLGTINPA